MDFSNDIYGLYTFMDLSKPLLINHFCTYLVIPVKTTPESPYEVLIPLGLRRISNSPVLVLQLSLDPSCPVRRLQSLLDSLFHNL